MYCLGDAFPSCVGRVGLNVYYDDNTNAGGYIDIFCPQAIVAFGRWDYNCGCANLVINVGYNPFYSSSAEQQNDIIFRLLLLGFKGLADHLASINNIKLEKVNDKKQDTPEGKELIYVTSVFPIEGIDVIAKQLGLEKFGYVFCRYGIPENLDEQLQALGITAIDTVKEDE